MLARRLLVWAVVVFAFFSVNLQAQTVFLTPSGGSGQSVSTFTGDPFNPGVSFSATSNTFLVLSLPQGNKFYVISKSATDAVLVTDAAGAVQKRISLPQAP